MLIRPRTVFKATICSVEVTCRHCEKVRTIPNVSVEGLEKWANGENIQDALPDLNEDQRELLISQTCPECWEKMWEGKDD